MAEWSVERQLWAHRRTEVLARLSQHIAEGAQVFIVSSVTEPVVETFAGRIGVHAIGTPIEITKGRLHFASSLVTSDRKVEQVLDRLGVEMVDFAYGDTWQDVPLLEHAANPVAVYPDPTLKETALQRGWEIMVDRTKGDIQ